jgi:hypothetical protein
MSVLPLDVAATSGDLGAFEMAPWPPSPAHLPPPPGAPPSMLQAPMGVRSDLPSAVDTSQSVDRPPPGAYGDAAPPGVPVAFAPDVPVENGHSLGLSFLLLAAGTYVGARTVGGLYGGVAGAIFGGSAGNLVRAARMVTRGTSTADHEAIVSATYGVIGVALGSYVVWKAKQPKTRGAST